MTDNNGGQDDKVGYGQPPRHSRWPKGVSGNPNGREKGHRGLKTDLEEALNTKTTVQNKLTGKMVKGRQQQHAIQRLVERASLGDLKAQALLFLAMITHGISAMVENGQVLFPQTAPWLSEFKAELLAFPNGRFDDQVDALTQLLIWVRQRLNFDIPEIAGPELCLGDGAWLTPEGIEYRASDDENAGCCDYDSYGE
jgi:hypothetical protein